MEAKKKAISIYNNVLAYANAYDLLSEDWQPKNQNESAINLSLIVAHNTLNEFTKLQLLNTHCKEPIMFYEEVISVINSWKD